MNDTLVPAALERLREAALEIAVKAGAEIRRIYEDEAYRIDRKADASPVTTADLAANRLIVDRLGALAPCLPVLAEESDLEPFETRTRWRHYWLVDPLDGTREFIKHNGEFCVNIALIEGHGAILGVIHAPMMHLTYHAVRGQGAWRRPQTGGDERIWTRRTPPDCPVIAGSRSHAGTRLGRFLERLGDHELISMGSAIKSCLVAEGSADLYPRFGPTSEWDTAAAQCIVEEAGGRLTGLDLRPLRYNTRESLDNPPFVVIGDPQFDWRPLIEGIM